MGQGGEGWAWPTFLSVTLGDPSQGSVHAGVHAATELYPQSRTWPNAVSKAVVLSPWVMALLGSHVR